MSSLVSIILPFYNARSWLAASIESVLSQTYSNFELLLVNDGSTDGSEDIARSYDDRRILLFRQGNRGVSAARNVAIRQMSGDFFCFLDADDTLPPDSLYSRLNVFEKNPMVEFVDGPVRIFSEKDSESTTYWRPSFRGEPLDELIKLTGSCFFGPTWMLRKIKGRHYEFEAGLSHGEDLMFYITQAVHGGVYTYVDQPIYYYRKGHQSAMSDLRGLGSGYTQISDLLLDIGLEPAQSVIFRKKTKRIMIKSFLANNQPLQAIKYLFA